MNILKRIVNAFNVGENNDEFLSQELERLDINPETNNIKIDSINSPSIKNLSNDYYSTLEVFYDKHKEEYELLKFVYEYGFTNMKRIKTYLNIKTNIETYLNYMDFIEKFDFLKEYLFVESCILDEYIKTNKCELVSKKEFKEEIPNENIKELMVFSEIAKEKLVLYYYDTLHKEISGEYYETYEPKDFNDALKDATLKLIRYKLNGTPSVHDDDKDDSDETHYGWYCSKYLKVGKESDNTFVLQTGNSFYILFKIESLYVCATSWKDETKKGLDLSFESFITDFKEREK
jgi:hypothetical protein